MIPPGEWHTYRRDDQLSGHCPLPGRITDPEVRWRYDLGGSGNECFTVRAAHGGCDLVVAYGGCLVRMNGTGEPVWKTASYGLCGISLVDDLDGDEIEEIVAGSGNEVFAFSAADGSLLWREWVGPPDAIGAPPTVVLAHAFDRSSSGKHLLVPLFSCREVLVFDFRKGARQATLAHRLWMDDAFHPTVAVGDLDGDGVDEVVVTKRGAVYVFDVFTGAMKSSVQWTSDEERRRNYGLLTIADVDGDGVNEIVVASDRVSRHVSVVDNDGAGNLSVLWDRFIQHIYPRDTTELRFAFHSVSDVDGDGLLEIAVSLFNTRGDGRWWLEVIDPLTGLVKYERADRYLWGVADVDGDGAAELLVSTETERMPAPFGEVEILGVCDGALERSWSHPRARFAMRSIRPCGPVAHMRPQIHGNDDVWTAPGPGGMSVYYFEPGALLELQCGASPRVVASMPLDDIAAPVLVQIADLHGNGERSLIVSDSRGALVAFLPNSAPTRFRLGFRLPTEGYSAPRPAPTAVVFTRPGEPAPYVAVEDSADTLHVLHADAAGIRLLWKRMGRGRIGYDQAFHTASVYDVDGDGSPELIVASGSPDGGSRLTALSPDGIQKQEWDVPHAPAPHPSSRVGVYDWLFLDLPDGPHLVAASYQSASMNSEATACLSLDGVVRWRRETAAYSDDEEGRGFGPWGSFSTDKYGRSLFFLAKDLVCQVDAATGEWLHEPWPLWLATKDTMDPAWTRAREETFGTALDPFTAYGSVILVDVDQDGEAELVIAGCFGGMGVLGADHNVRWWKRTPFTDVLLRLPGIGDLRGDGSRCLGIGHADGTFICYDAADGHEVWRLPLGAVTTDVVTCDIDGDGRDEFITGTTDGRILALGPGPDGRGEIIWSVDLGFATASPIIADTNADGLPEILVLSGDGYLHCIGQAI